jgi:putative NADPH-quinone reductase
MGTTITIIQGHPDPDQSHLGHALATAYREAAEQAGHQVRTVTVAELDFPLLRSQAEWAEGDVPTALRDAQEAIAWAQQLVICYPLWLGTMPALLKGFLEQTLRPGFAIGRSSDPHKPWSELLGGKRARVIVTMGMPAWAYRWWFRAHSLKSLQRNILGFCGVKPVRATLVGMVDRLDDAARARWLAKLAELGRSAR